MDRMTQTRKDIVVGVDTHRDSHVAVALDALGGRLGERSVPTTRAGYTELERWAAGLGLVQAFGVEGTGSYGAGLARHLRAAGHAVREVDRPDRQARRRLGKSDPLDAEAAARAVLAGTATTRPKRADGSIEALRLLVLTRRSAEKARSAAMIQLRAVMVTAPAELREALAGLGPVTLLGRCRAFRPGAPVDPTERHPACPARAGPPHPGPRRGAGRGGLGDGPADPRAGTGAAGHVRGGTRQRRRPAGRGRRWPRPAAFGGRLRRPLRGQPHPGLVGPAHPSPAQPGWRPPGQPGAVCHRPHAPRPPWPRPAHTWSGGRPRGGPSARSSAASSATSPARCSRSWPAPRPVDRS